MKCKKCKRPLEINEKKLCPHCKNERDKNVKNILQIAAGIGIGVGVVIGKIRRIINKK